MDSLLGPSGLVVAVAVGALHVAPGDPHLVVDFIPVDIVVNAALACAWYKGTGKEGGGGGGDVGGAGGSGSRWGAVGSERQREDGGARDGGAGALVVHVATSSVC
jgi:hypothetical protein